MAREDQKVQDLPDITTSSNDQHIMVITDTQNNQLRKEKIGNFINDFISSDANNGLIAASDGKLYSVDTTNASNILSGTLDKNRLPDSGVEPKTYTFPESIEVDAKGIVKSVKEGTPGGNNADKDLSNITDAGKAVIKQNSGSGHYLGQLIYSPIPILNELGETPAELHFADGGVVSSSQYDGFFAHIKKLASLYPAVSKTEAEWQAMKEKYGEVPAFVIDDGAGTIRLPLIVNPIKGVTDLSRLGQVIEAGLPNITGERSNFVWASNNLEPTGAYYNGEIYNQQIEANRNQGHDVAKNGFDASLSNPIYGKSDTVQPQQPTGCYYIVLATGTTQDYTALEEFAPVEVHSILESKWSDKILNNPAWLRSNGQWNPKSVYEKEFNHLLLEYNGAVDETETVGGVEITFRRGLDTEMKITTDKPAYDAILGATGTAWYYVLDIANEQFCLPQTNGFFQCASSGAGDFVEAGLPSIEHTHSFPLTSNETGANDATAGHTNLSTITTSVNSPVSEVYGKSDTVQPPAVKGYLYFYTGNVAKNASVINAGRMQEQIVDLASRVHIVDTYVNGASGYRLWSDGYKQQWGRQNAGQVVFLKEFSNTDYSITTACLQDVNIEYSNLTTSGFTLGANGCWRAEGY